MVCTAPIGTFDSDQDPATLCTVDNLCTQECAAGTEDHDCQSTSACVGCLPGKYSAGGIAPESSCVPCTAGQSDADSNGATPCADCAAGFFSVAGQAGGCTACPNGQYAPAQTADECVPCIAGTADEDSNPSTVCTTCTAGFYAAAALTDGWVQGPCSACPAGTFFGSPGGISSANCEACAGGQYAASGSSTCAFCTAGEADEDVNPATPCTSCSAGKSLSSLAACPFRLRWLSVSSYSCGTGTYAGCGATLCAECTPGSVDGDSNPATPCTDCLTGQTWQETCNTLSGDSVCSYACVSCEAGTADADSDPTTGEMCSTCWPLGSFSAIKCTTNHLRAQGAWYARRANTLHSSLWYAPSVVSSMTSRGYIIRASTTTTPIRRLRAWHVLWARSGYSTGGWLQPPLSPTTSHLALPAPWARRTVTPTRCRRVLTARWVSTAMA